MTKDKNRTKKSRTSEKFRWVTITYSDTETRIPKLKNRTSRKCTIH